MALTHPYNLPLIHNFRVEFDLPGAGDLDVRFREVSGLSMELEQETVTEGGENRFVHKVPVRASYPDLVLKRGLIGESAVTQWIRDAIQNLVIRPITMSVVLLDPKLEPLRTFSVVNAWPKKWSVSDFNAETSEIAVETLELAYAYFREV
ncbi:MAG: phage tail protein [Roseibium album]|uniref:T4-like virus tail tube protein gp19 n=1 Tax=Roseibium album TaxID=311410 RepID=A0A0M7AXD5_9HYPH|nr:MULTISPECIES: phage tail protein [Stappiaceae]MBG6147325.1 phage tail-like protein [Labrenzia sp. EL_142]MBG6159948.1 phage tail-like protein [Labrenzia sp. EL_162]MBG6166035.1 phage tail-like protein [Labrenzia sp. EL_195]MBG6178009.1 phage tail-like protein [Labrenzia sp. EL_132]MBG6198480.1 phage tail-like protein [Labrenzia sp. EL_159]MBG6204919.1 phage tail-like protein [Labrenzia sp. EL_13]MBG6210634.1 phage tail-like protein [Labrenzia sp. EL_126]MBG6232632.1 phage tail-like prote